jgi:uncharacterized protein YlxW (UPF0749 family)
MLAICVATCDNILCPDRRAQMLSLIDSLVKDRQMVESEMLRIDAEVKKLQAQYKRLDSDRENLIYAINQLDEVADG